jgi:hypothetical protein
VCCFAAAQLNQDEATQQPHTWTVNTAAVNGAPCVQVVVCCCPAHNSSCPKRASLPPPPLTLVTAAPAAAAVAPLAFAAAAASVATVVINRRAAWPYQEAAAAPACLLQLLRPATCCLPTSCSACCHCMQKSVRYVRIHHTCPWSATGAQVVVNLRQALCCCSATGEHDPCLGRLLPPAHGLVAPQKHS